jgi:hypothetical protein
LLFFDLSAFPGNATLVDAMLSLHETTGIGGTVRASRALASWTEGSGSREWARVPITVRESAGVPRTLEPIGVTLTFPPGSIADPAKDVRVWDGTREVPSQVYRYGYTGGEVSEALLYFGVTIGAFQSKTFDVTYSANGSAVPAYRQLTWSSSPTWTAGPAGVSVTGATIADIDRDGKLEAVFGGDDGVLRIANSTGTVVRSVQVSALGNSIPFPPQVVDLRHNGSVAIIAITNDPSLAGLDTNGNVMWANPAVPLLHTIPAFVDVNGDGVLEILVGGKMKQMQALSGLDGLTVLRNYSVPLEAYTPMVADIDGDGTPEILFGGSDGVVHAFSLGGTELWASAPPRVQFVEMPLAYGDLRGDGIDAVVSGDRPSRISTATARSRSSSGTPRGPSTPSRPTGRPCGLTTRERSRAGRPRSAIWTGVARPTSSSRGRPSSRGRRATN